VRTQGAIPTKDLYLHHANACAGCEQKLSQFNEVRHYLGLPDLDAPPTVSVEESGISLIVVARDDASGLRRLLTSIRPHVDEILVTVQQSSDETLIVAQELADVAIEAPANIYIEQDFKQMIDRARYPVILNLDADETVAHP
jgi:hypothetical protein